MPKPKYIKPEDEFFAAPPVHENTGVPDAETSYYDMQGYGDFIQGLAPYTRQSDVSQVSYWNDPTRIARYYLAGKSVIDAGKTLPPWLQTIYPALETSYKYLSTKNAGKQWYDWQAITADDPLAELTANMTVPPIEALPDWERGKYGQYSYKLDSQGYIPVDKVQAAAYLPDDVYQQYVDSQPGAQSVLYLPREVYDTMYSAQQTGQVQGVQDYANLPADERLIMQFLSTPWAMAAATGGVPMATALGSVIAGGTPASALILPAALMAGGLGLGYLSKQEMEAGKTTTAGVFSDDFAWATELSLIIDGLAEGVERTAGFASQLATDTGETLANPKAAWKAAHLFYEAGGSESRVITEDGEQMSVIEAQARDKKTGVKHKYYMRGLDGELYEYDNLLDQARERIKGAQSPQEVAEIYMDIQNQAGAYGAAFEAVGHILLDPLNVMGDVYAGSSKLANKGKIAALTKKIGTLTAGLEGLDDAAKAAKMPEIEGLQKQVQQLQVQNMAWDMTERSIPIPVIKDGKLGFKPSGIPMPQDMTRVWEQSQAYGTLLRATVSDPGEIAKMGAYARAFAGVVKDAAGNWTYKDMLPPPAAQKGLKGLAASVGAFFTPNPMARAQKVVTEGTTIWNLMVSDARIEDMPAVIARMTVGADDLAKDMTFMKTPGGWALSKSLQEGAQKIADFHQNVWASEASIATRKLFGEMARILGYPNDADAVYKVLNRCKTVPEADAVLRDVVTRLTAAANAGDANAAKLVEIFKKATPESLVKVVNAAAKGEIALDEHAYKAHLTQLVGTIMEKWASGFYGLKPDAILWKFGGLIKSAQSLALLGVNPFYPLNNWIWNASMMAYSGTLGFTSQKDIATWNRSFGAESPRAREGIGVAGEGGKRVESPMGDAVRYHADTASTTEEKVGAWLDDTKARLTGFNQRFGLMSRVAQTIESRHSEQVSYQVQRRSFENMWHPGKGFDEMPTEMADGLRAAGVDPQFVYSLIEHGLNIEGIAKSIYDGGYAFHTRNLDAQTRQLLTDLGMMDDLTRRLQGAKTREDAAQVMDDVFGEALHKIEVANTEYRAKKAEEIYTQIVGEGLQSAVKAIDDMAAARAERHFNWMQATDEFYASIDGLTPEQQAMRKRAFFARGEKEWNILWGNEEAVTIGIVRALTGQSDENGALYTQIVGSVGLIRNRWNEFFRLRGELAVMIGDIDLPGSSTGNALRERMAKVIGEDRVRALLPKDAKKADFWKAHREVMDEAYRQAADFEDALLDDIDVGYADAFNARYPQANDAVTAWRQATRAYRKQMVGAQQYFRSGNAAVLDALPEGAALKADIDRILGKRKLSELSVTDRNRAWKAFNDKIYKPLVARQLADTYGGMLAAWQATFGTAQPQPPAVPPVKPQAEAPAPEPVKPTTNEPVAPAPQQPAPGTWERKYKVGETDVVEGGSVGTEHAGLVSPKRLRELAQKYNIDLTDLTAVLGGDWSILGEAEVVQRMLAHNAAKTQADMVQADAINQKAAVILDGWQDARDGYREGLKQVLGLSDAEADDVMVVQDAWAEYWGKMTGKPPETYWKEHVARFEVGGKGDLQSLQQEKQPFEMTMDEFAFSWLPKNKASAYESEYQERLIDLRKTFGRELTDAELAIVYDASVKYVDDFYNDALTAIDNAKKILSYVRSNHPEISIQIAGSMAKGSFWSKGKRSFDLDFHITGIDWDGKSPTPDYFKKMVKKIRDIDSRADIFVTYDNALYVLANGRLTRKNGAFGKERFMHANGLITRGQPMEFSEFEQSFYKDISTHKRIVEEAISAGKNVPTEVLRDYGLLQSSPSSAKAAVSWLEDGRAVIHALDKPDVSSAVHEFSHVWLRSLTREPLFADDLNVVTAWLRGQGKEVPDDWAAQPVEMYRDAHETFARASERYFTDGIAPKGASAGLIKAFESLKRFMLRIYKKITGSAIDVPITPELRQLFDKWTLGKKGVAVEAEPVKPKQPWEMTRKEIITRRALPEMKPPPEKGQFAAIETDDGAIYFDIENPIEIHAFLIDKLGIPRERVRSGGYVIDGVYTATASDATKIGEVARANVAVEHKRQIRKAIINGEFIPPEVLASYPDIAEPIKPVAPDDFVTTVQHDMDVLDAKPLPTADDVAKADYWSDPAKNRRKNADLRANLDQMTPDELKATVEQLRGEVYQDELTGLPNVKAWAEAERLPVAVVLDVRGLKKTNDTYGMAAGDDLLRAVAQILQKHGIEGEVYHLHGDEFVMQFDNTDAARAAIDAALPEVRNLVLETGGKRLFGFDLHVGMGAGDGAFGKADEFLRAGKAGKDRLDVDVREAKPAITPDFPSKVKMDGIEKFIGRKRPWTIEEINMYRMRNLYEGGDTRFLDSFIRSPDVDIYKIVNIIINRGFPVEYVLDALNNIINMPGKKEYGTEYHRYYRFSSKTYDYPDTMRSNAKKLFEIFWRMREPGSKFGDVIKDDAPSPAPDVTTPKVDEPQTLFDGDTAVKPDDTAAPVEPAAEETRWWAMPFEKAVGEMIVKRDFKNKPWFVFDLDGDGTPVGKFATKEDAIKLARKIHQDAIQRRVDLPPEIRKGLDAFTPSEAADFVRQIREYHRKLAQKFMDGGGEKWQGKTYQDFLNDAPPSIDAKVDASFTVGKTTIKVSSAEQLANVYFALTGKKLRGFEWRIDLKPLPKERAKTWKATEYGLLAELTAAIRMYKGLDVDRINAQFEALGIPKPDGFDDLLAKLQKELSPEDIQKIVDNRDAVLGTEDVRNDDDQIVGWRAVVQDDWSPLPNSLTGKVRYRMLYQTAEPGRVTATMMKTGKDYDFRYRVVSLDDLIASHDIKGKPNPRHTLNPREREGKAYIHEAAGRAAALDPKLLLTDYKTIADGTPIIGDDMLVESGNGRTISMLMARQDYPERWRTYQTQLRETIGSYGLDASVLDGVKDPVLVRERITPLTPEERKQFVADANESGQTALSDTEIAAMDAQWLTPDIIRKLDIGDNETLVKAVQATRNEGFFKAFLDNLPPSQRGRLVGEDGKFTEAGLKRIQNALIFAVYGKDSPIGRVLVESGETDIKTLGAVVYETLPQMADLEMSIRSGMARADLSIAEDVTKSFTKLMQLRIDGLSVSDYLKQSVWGEAELTDFQRLLLAYIDRNLTKKSKIVDVLRRYTASAKTQPVDDVPSLFAEPPLDREAIFRAIVGKDKDDAAFDWIPKVEAPDLAPREPGEVARLMAVDAVTPQMELWNSDIAPRITDITRAVTDNPDTEGSVFKRYREGYKRANPNATDAEVAEAETGLKRQVKGYLAGVDSKLKAVKFAATRHGDTMRDFTLNNYGWRFGFDKVLEMYMPYQFFYTRSLANWGLRMAMNPQYFSHYMQLSQLMEKLNRDDESLPSRLRGKLRIPTPWLPDWMGDSTYIDPLKVIFPFHQLARPLINQSKTNNVILKRTVGILQQWSEDEEYDKEAVIEAIRTRSGDLWERAKTQATQEIDDNPGGLIADIVQPSLPIQLATTPKDKWSQLPATRFAQNIAGAAGYTGVVDAPVRKALGMPERDEYSQYAIDQMLANLAAENPDQTEAIKQAMITQSGEWWDKAVKRAGNMGAKKYVFAFLSADMFPEGERDQRELKKEYDIALKKLQAGDRDAYDQFFEAHPEYEVQRQAWNDPEARMHRLLISEVWKRYLALNPSDKDAARTAFGDMFDTAFLNKDTRAYDAINDQTLASWAKALGGSVPDNVTTTPMSVKQTDPAIARQLDQYYKDRDKAFPGLADYQNLYFGLPEGQRKAFEAQFPQYAGYQQWRNRWLANHPDAAPYITSESSELAGTSANVQNVVYTYRAERDRLFPGVDALQSEYYAITDEDAQKEWLKANPTLKQYWEWKRQYNALHPEAAPYIMSDESLSNAILGYSQSALDPQILGAFSAELSSQVLGWAVNGETLGGAARSELERVWNENGQPGGSFEAWLALLEDYLNQ